LTAHEANWLVRNEWARTADDIIWRRTKFGLDMTAQDIEQLNDYLANAFFAA